MYDLQTYHISWVEVVFNTFNGEIQSPTFGLDRQVVEIKGLYDSTKQLPVLVISGAATWDQYVCSAVLPPESGNSVGVQFTSAFHCD